MAVNYYMKEKQNKFAKTDKEDEYLIHYKDDATGWKWCKNMISLKVSGVKVTTISCIILIC